MRVVHLNSFYGIGGAAKAHFRIHEELIKLGVDSMFYVLAAENRDISEVNFVQEEGRWNHYWARQRKKHIKEESKELLAIPEQRELFSHDGCRYVKSNIFRRLPRADILHLNWISGFLDSKNFFRHVPRHQKLVWRLADMNPLTGGCHFSEGCNRFHERCGCCPQLSSINEKDLSRQIFDRKKRMMKRFSDHQVTIVYVSKWMEDNIRNSPILSRFNRIYIPTGVDHSMFRPRNKALLRTKYDLPQKKMIVLNVADGNLNKTRKGGIYYKKIVDHFSNSEDILFLEIGNAKRERIGNRHILGRIDSPSAIADYYALSDLFIYTGIEDNLPNTLLEAMACGLIVVSFQTGGIPDVIRNEENGFVVKKKDVRSIIELIDKLSQQGVEFNSLSANARKTIEERFTLEIQGRSYDRLYHEIMVQK